MKRKKKIFTMLFLLSIFLSMFVRTELNLVSASSADDKHKVVFETKSSHSLPGYSWLYYDLGYQNSFRVFEWSMSSSLKPIKCYIMTQSNYNEFAAGRAFYYYNLLGSTESTMSRESAWRIDFYADWVVVFWNDNLRTTVVEVELSLYTITARLGTVSYDAYSQSDVFVYPDSLRITYSISFFYDKQQEFGDTRIFLNENVEIEFQLWEHDEILVKEYSGTFFIETYEEDPIKWWYNRPYTYDFGSVPSTDDTNVYTIRVSVWWQSSSATPDDTNSIDINEQFYPLDWAKTQKRKSIIRNSLIFGSIGLAVTAVIISVVLTNKKKKKLQETEVTDPELGEQKLCPICGGTTNESETFCGNCGTNLSEVKNNE